MRASEVLSKRPRVFYGWWVVLAGTVVLFYGGGTFFYGFGVFFNPIREEFGWPAAITALAFSIYRLEAGIGAPLVGFLVDKFGPRRLMLFGVGVVGLGFIMLSRIDSLLSFYTAFITLSLGFSFSMGGVSQVAVVNWFRRRLGLALGVMMVGAGLTGTIAPLLALLISHYDWRTTLVIVGVGAWVVGLPMSMVVRHRPEHYGMLPDGDEAADVATNSADSEKYSSTEIEGVHWSKALMSRSFWFVSLASGLGGVSISAVIVLLVPYLESVGVPREQAAFTITFLTLSSLIGRLGMGWLGDRIDKRHLLAVAFIVQALGVLVLSVVTEFWMIGPFLLLFGPAYGGGIPLRPALLAGYFGRKYFGTIQGLNQTVLAIGGIAGPYIAALIFDIEGSYQKAWILFAVLAAVAAGLILLARPPELETDI